MKDKNQTLKWRFDVSTFRLIGRELITDRVTALFELVKIAMMPMHVRLLFDSQMWGLTNKMLS